MFGVKRIGKAGFGFLKSASSSVWTKIKNIPQLGSTNPDEIQQSPEKRAESSNQVFLEDDMINQDEPNNAMEVSFFSEASA